MDRPLSPLWSHYPRVLTYRQSPISSRHHFGSFSQWFYFNARRRIGSDTYLISTASFSTQLHFLFTLHVFYISLHFLVLFVFCVSDTLVLHALHVGSFSFIFFSRRTYFVLLMTYPYLFHPSNLFPSLACLPVTCPYSKGILYHRPRTLRILLRCAVQRTSPRIPSCSIYL